MTHVLCTELSRLFMVACAILLDTGRSWSTLTNILHYKHAQWGVALWLWYYQTGIPRLLCHTKPHTLPAICLLQ